MKKLCLHDICIRTNFHQNQPINECARIILSERWSCMTFDDLKIHTSFYVFKMLVFLKSFKTIGRKTKNISQKKMILKF